MKMRIISKRQVLGYTLFATAIAVVAPLLVVGGSLAMLPGLPRMALLGGMAMAGLIPLLIAPPIAYIGLTMLRMLTLTIDRLDSQIRFDSLTGVLNRGHFLDRLRASHRSGVLLIVDADRFKCINDTHGHGVGDQALAMLGNAIAQGVGPSAMVGRLGGEEFAIFLPDRDLDEGRAIAESVCTSIRTLKPLIDGKLVPLTVSIGGSWYPRGTLISSALKAADELLYRAKDNGRDQAVIAEPQRRTRQR